ncbi:MAG: glycosyltransferase family 4 protein [Candidatus Pacebacteria bacterium]|nr:glycosyltransferase family 4 protein [Candidatus Paceibacterota bacterium]
MNFQITNLTFKKYPVQTADAIYIQEFSKAFSSILGTNYTLTVVKKNKHILGVKSVIVPKITKGSSRSLTYFLWVGKHVLFTNKGHIYFSNDKFLLLAVIIWRRVFFKKVYIVSDWHMIDKKWKDNFVAKNSVALITTSKRLKENIVNNFDISGQKIFVAYGGINVDFDKNKKLNELELRKKLHLPVHTFLIGYVGLFKTLGQEKGIDIMIMACKKLKKENTKNPFLFVFVGGSGEEILEYKQLAKKHKVSDLCLFFEKKDPATAFLFERALDVLVIPYPNKFHYREYGFPMKVYEYMVSNTPIIYSNLKILAEILKPCATSFEAGNYDSLSQVIKKMIENPSFFNEKTLKAKRIVLSKYTWRKKAENIIKFIKNRILK